MKRKENMIQSKVKKILASHPIYMNDMMILIIILIIVFAINIILIIKIKLINIFQNIIRRIWVKVINFPSYPCNLDKLNMRQCAICLNNLKLEVSFACFHSFCGIHFIYFNGFIIFFLLISLLYY